MGEARKTYILEARYCKGCLKEIMEDRISEFVHEIELGKEWPLKSFDICIRVSQRLYSDLKAACYNYDARRFEFGRWMFADIRIDMRLSPDIMKLEVRWEEEKMGPDESYLEQIKNIKLYWAPTEAWVKPKKVIWNKPATIVYWADGSKTVVKVRKGDKWDPEKGYAMAIVKKFMGLKKFYEAFDAWKED